MKTLKKLNQGGDTIIEVMIVLAILSLSFGISYATANKGLGESLSAEQHSQALGILDSQVEELRDAVANGYIGSSTSGYFCMNNISATTPISPGVPQSAQQDSSTGYTEYGSVGSGCIFQSGSNSTKYYVSITAASPASATGTTYAYDTPVPCPSSGCSENSFTFMIRWDGVGSLGPQQESLTYRIGSDVVGAGGYLQTGPGSVATPSQAFIDNGSDYSFCGNGENKLNDGKDGCFKSGTSMYAYRQVFVRYDFTSPAPGPVTGAPTTLTINYQQYGAPIPAAANYYFDLAICAIPSSGPPPVGIGNQTPGTNTGPINPQTENYPCPGNAPVTIAYLSSNSTMGTVTINGFKTGNSIEIDWLNNVPFEPYNANLQINSLTLTQN